MKKDPVKHVLFITWLLIAALLFHVFILGRHEGHSNTMVLSLSLIYIVIAISPLYSALKHLQKRIDTLEEKLNIQQRQDQQDKE